MNLNLIVGFIELLKIWFRSHHLTDWLPKQLFDRLHQGGLDEFAFIIQSIECSYFAHVYNEATSVMMSERSMETGKPHKTTVAYGA